MKQKVLVDIGVTCEPPYRTMLDNMAIARVLALDLGTKTGWANDYQSPGHGTIKLAGKKGEHPGHRYLRFQDWLMASRLPDVIVYEDVKRHQGTIAAHVYGGLKAMMLAHAAHFNVPCVGFGVGTIKKFATGKGNASKDMMIAAAHEHSGELFIDDNEADAYWILQYALEEL